MTKPTRATAAIAALAAAVAIAAGCGNSEQNEYADEVNELQAELVNEVTNTVTEAAPSDAKAYREIADELRATFDAKADEFEAVEAPEDVADLHAQLVEAIRAVGEQIGDAERGFASGNPRQAQRAAASLQQAGTELQARLDAVIDQINAELGD
jgi:hypothetical protein